MALYRLTATGSLPGEQFNFGVHVDGGAGDAAGAAAAWSTALTAGWQDITDGMEVVFSTDVVILVAHAAELDPLTGHQVDAASATVSLPGTDSADMLPHECALVVSTHAASERRQNQGRMYLPPPSVAQITDGRLEATPRARVAAAAAIIMNSLQGAAFTPVIKHPDMTSDAITQIKVGDVIDAQRRRRNRLVEVYSIVGV
jgi:hypothetical protein